MHSLLLLLLAASAVFEVTAPTPEERAARAKIRCGGAADQLSPATFRCHDQPGVDVTDALLTTELVVRGKITKIETPPAKLFGDPAPEWRRATVKVARVLKGNSGTRETKFLFISSTKEGNEAYVKVKVGQEGIWLLTRGGGPVKELVMLTTLDDHPVSAEEYLGELIALTACPAKLEGTCAADGQICPAPGVNCTCESPCGGGAAPPPNYVAPLRWLCRPASCATAVEGGKCADGLKCEGCWGTFPVTCEKGRWKTHHISPPP